MKTRCMCRLTAPLLVAYAILGLIPISGFGQDAYEPDDDMLTQAKSITSGVAQNRTFHNQNDIDNAKFEGVAGRTYRIETYNVSPGWGMGVSLNTITPGSGSTQLHFESNLNGGISFEYTVAETRTYYIRLTQRSGTGSGNYTLKLTDLRVVDNNPPTPDPMTWVYREGPRPASMSSITMTATTATDPEGNGVEYYFQETSGNPGANSSGWQDSRTYTDTGLSSGYTYSYRVKARDKSPNRNETAYSVVAHSGVNDAYEPDDDLATQAKTITPGVAQNRTFHNQDDIDNAKFEGVAGRTYRIETYNVSPGWGMGVSLNTITPGSGSTQLHFESNLNGGISFEYTVAETRTYYIRLTQRSGTGSGNYTLKLSEVVTEQWAPWVRILDLPEAGGSDVDVLIRHDGFWRGSVGYGIPDMKAGHARGFGYRVGDEDFLISNMGSIQRQIIGRAASTMDAALNRTSGNMLPYLPTSSDLFTFDIGTVQYSTIVEWQESSGGQVFKGRAFRWRTAYDILTGQPGQPHFGWAGEYHNAAMRRNIYRDAIRTIVYQVDRSQNQPSIWQFQFLDGASIVQDSLAYLAVKEGIPIAQQGVLMAAKDALDHMRTLAVDVSGTIPATDYVPMMQNLWDAQDMLENDPFVRSELVAYLGPSHAKALNWLNGLTTALKIIDAVLKGLSIADDISRVFYFNTIYAQLGGEPQVAERISTLQAYYAQAILFDQALADAINDEVVAFNQATNADNVYAMIAGLPLEARQHLYNVVKTGVQIGADKVFGAGVAAAFGTITSIPALGMVAVNAFLFSELVGAVFDLGEDSQRLMQGNAYLSLDWFLNERMKSLLPIVADGYSSLSSDDLLHMSAMSSLGTYAARQAVANYKAAIEDAGLIGNFIHWLVRGFDDGSAYLQALDAQMAFSLDMHYVQRREALWDNAMTLVNINNTAYHGWQIPCWVYSGSFAYSLAATTTPTEVTIAISTSPSQGGTASGGGIVPLGASVTISAQPRAGYSFDAWSEGGTEISTSQNYTFTADGNRNLLARFTAVLYGINTDSSPAGGGTTSGRGTKIYGDNVIVTATPNSGYLFLNWTEDGAIVSTSQTYSFSATRSRSLVANFAGGTAATPIFNPDGGAHAGNTASVVVYCTTVGASIHYTTNDSEPTEASPTMTSGGTVAVPVPGTLKAKAFKSGMNPSSTKSASYTLADTVATPTFNPDGGAHPGSSVNVVVSCVTAGATIRYTIDGSEPLLSSPIVDSGNSVPVSLPGTLRAKAWKDGMSSSATKTADYSKSASSVLELATLYYAADETSGTTVFDAMGLNHGTLNEPDTIAFVHAPELDRYCIRKTDSTTSGLFPSAAPVTAATFSMSCWARPAPGGGGQFFLIAGGEPEKTYWIYADQIGYQYTKRSTYPNKRASFAGDGGWHLYTWVNQDRGDGTASLRMYVDGIKVFDDILSSSEYDVRRPAEQVFLCQRPYSMFYYQYIGDISNIAVFDGLALSDGEVATLYEETDPRVHADIVATPTFNPDGGTQPGSSVNVTITCVTAGATIRYTSGSGTTPGADPTEATPNTVVSGGTVEVPVPGWLKARAWKDGMDPSGVESAIYQFRSYYYRISSSAPTTVLSVSPDGTMVWQNSTLSASGKIQRARELDSGTWEDIHEFTATESIMSHNVLDLVP